MKSNIILFLLLALLINCNKQGHIFYKENEIQNDQIYLFFRETKSKAGVVSKSYNINNSQYSHVAIGGIINGEITVYHILNDKYESKNGRKSDLIYEEVQEFYNPPNEEVLSGGIFYVNNITNIDFVRFRKILISLKKRNLKFDKKFESKVDDNFYCSELVIYVLENTKNSLKFNLVEKKLTGIDKILLKRDSIFYYPTDIFIHDKNFELVKEW